MKLNDIKKGQKILIKNAKSYDALIKKNEIEVVVDFVTKNYVAVKYDNGQLNIDIKDVIKIIKENKMKINFETIKKLSLNEQYSNTEIEIAALGGDTMSIAEMLKTKGMNPCHADDVMVFIRSGMSEMEALNQIKNK